MNTQHPTHPEAPQAADAPDPAVAPAADRRDRLAANPRARLLALVLGLLVIAIAAWRFVAASGPPTAEDAHTEEAPSAELHAEVVFLTDAEIAEFGIEIRTAGPGTMSVEKQLSGEVRANEDRYAHVTPRVSGVVRSVGAHVGSHVRAGQVLAVIESRELADLKADYLAALEREDLSRASFEREERLYAQEIASEADFLEARQALAEARIRTRSARQKLLALGFSDAYIRALPEESERSLVTYPLTAPIPGRVIEKHVVPGEAIEATTTAFEVADLSSVWVDFSIYQRDLGVVREGQEVSIDAGTGQPRTRGTISYVRPIVGEETRTALARAVIPNPDGLLRPGQFVTGLLAVGAVEVAVVVPVSALAAVEGATVVFVRTATGFEARPVEVGERAGGQAAITDGLAPGERYAAEGVFALKAELGKSELDAGHAH